MGPRERGQIFCACMKNSLSAIKTVVNKTTVPVSDEVQSARLSPVLARSGELSGG